MVIIGIHEKDTNFLSDFELFACINSKFFGNLIFIIDIYTLKNFSLDMILVSTSKNLMKATFSEEIVLYQHNERYQ